MAETLALSFWTVSNRLAMSSSLLILRYPLMKIFSVLLRLLHFLGLQHNSYIRGSLTSEIMSEKVNVSWLRFLVKLFIFFHIPFLDFLLFSFKKNISFSMFEAWTLVLMNSPIILPRLVKRPKILPKLTLNVRML